MDEPLLFEELEDELLPHHELLDPELDVGLDVVLEELPHELEVEVAGLVAAAVVFAAVEVVVVGVEEKAETVWLFLDGSVTL